MSMSAPLLRLEEITRNFGAIEALRGISFEIARGEVVALLGDNGAGKSTLVKIISGGLEATSGRIVYEGVERRFSSPAEAKAAGIETVYQDLSLCTNVDVVANFFMGREIVKRYFGIPILQEAEMEAAVAKTMANAGARRSSSTALSTGAASWCCWTSRSRRSASSRPGAGWRWSSASLPKASA